MAAQRCSLFAFSIWVFACRFWSERSFDDAMNQSVTRVFLVSLCALCLGGSLLLEQGAASDATAQLLTIDSVGFDATLQAVDADGNVVFQVATPGVESSEAGSPTSIERRSVSIDELVRWGHPAPRKAQPWVVLADGSLLVASADWSGGASVRTEDEAVVVLTEAFDEVQLPRKAVRGIVFDQRRHDDDRRELEQIARDFRGNRDAILLTNEDRVAGDVVAIAKGSLTLRVSGSEVKLPISRVRGVWFAAPPVGVRKAPGARSSSGNVAIGLRDGTMLYAQAMNGRDDRVSLALTNAIKFEGLRIDDIAFLQTLNSTRFVYLSDLESVEFRHIPYLTLDWPWKRDRAVIGRPIAAHGATYLKGIGMHSASRLTYRLDDKFRRFEASIAIDDSAGVRGSVAFGVYLLREGKWNEAFLSEVVRGGEPPRPVSLDVRGAQGMTLVVDYADRGDELDRADWLDARLVRVD